jgi:non-ribosomal peptide synthetase component F
MDQGLESPVVVFMRRQPLFVISELAVLKADGVYMPIDISYPKARAEYMMEQADARLIITETAVLDRLPTPTKLQRVLCIDKEWDFIHRTGNPRNLPHIHTPSSLATIIFTSGSTGKPKGVMLPNLGIVNYAVWHWRRTGMTADDRHTHLATVTFDGSLLETWPTLMIGASIVFVMDDADKLDPNRFVAWATKAQVTMSWLPTVLAEGTTILSSRS